jgi:hypothetical protein
MRAQASVEGVDETARPLARARRSPPPSRANGYGGVFPVGRLEDLVRAAAGPDAPLAAWRRYLERPGAAAADEGERRLYPLVGARLAGQPLSAAEEAPIRAQRRAATVRQAMVFDAAARIDDLLRAAGVTPVFLKGVALQVRVFRERAIRASSDVDIFVAPGELAACLRAVEAAGWARVEAWPRTGEPQVMARVLMQANYRMPNRMLVDVHWMPRAVMEFDADAQARFVAGAVDREWRGRVWRVPSDTALLFETVLHGLHFNTVTPIRWMTDALALLATDDCAVDWEALLALAADTRSRARLALGLGALGAYTDAIPPRVLTCLAAARLSSLERFEARRVLAGRTPVVSGLAMAASHYFLRSREPLARRFAGFPAYYVRRGLKCLGWADVGARIGQRFMGRGR